MRFSLLTVIAALTAVLSVSATQSVLSGGCNANGEICSQSSECCSGYCTNSYTCDEF
ncbi:hypothetical protein BDR05DRAFT_963458 [Suillus weaverae]|nr:hypothetical protein BDR05DRAFT_963458 [Suillus weaverae]